MPELLGQIINKKCKCEASLIDHAAAMARQEGCSIGQYLIDKEGFAEELVYESLAQQFQLPFIKNLREQVSENLIRELPIELFRDGRCFPIVQEDNTILIAVGNPIDLSIVMDVEALTGFLVEVAVATPTAMKDCTHEIFGGESLLSRSAGQLSKEFSNQLTGDEGAMSLEEIKKRTESEPVVKLANMIFDEAINLRASDVHIEPTEHNAVVRFRIDGMLKQHMELNRSMYLPLTSRIKIQADLDIAEKRIPQDGRIRYTAGISQFDFRVSTLPTHCGEKTVIRILKHDKGLLDINNVGMAPQVLERMLEVIEKPQGMVFVTGPTGSGKSSTLFACLNRIRKKAINITTIENPIEYKLEGINQVQVNEKAGNTFAAVLRSILRQDPDVILVGEIRDGETAQIAIQASQTGHLVFSTLHTNDAISAITRLRDLGIADYLIASSTLGILAQRLVRVLCPHCKFKAPPSEEIKKRWAMQLGDVPFPKAYSAKGCERCANMGYSGRTGIFELVYIDETMREMITEKISESKMRQYLRRSGTKSLIQNGIRIIEEGITTPDELLRVVLVEDIIQMKEE